MVAGSSPVYSTFLSYKERKNQVKDIYSMSFFVIILYIKAILVQGIFFDTYSISLFGYSFGILFFFIAKYLHLKIVCTIFAPEDDK